MRFQHFVSEAMDNANHTDALQVFMTPDFSKFEPVLSSHPDLIAEF